MPNVPMLPTTIRFAPDAMDLVNKAAKDMGISVAQFVRESAIMRAMLCEGVFHDDLQGLSESVQRLARRSDD